MGRDLLFVFNFGSLYQILLGISETIKNDHPFTPDLCGLVCAAFASAPVILSTELAFRGIVFHPCAAARTVGISDVHLDVSDVLKRRQLSNPSYGISRGVPVS